MLLCRQDLGCLCNAHSECASDCRLQLPDPTLGTVQLTGATVHIYTQLAAQHGREANICARKLACNLGKPKQALQHSFRVTFQWLLQLLQVHPELLPM